MCKEYSRYDKNLKLSVVKTYLKSNVSAEMLAKEYGVKSDTQILDWVKNIKNQEKGLLTGEESVKM